MPPLAALPIALLLAAALRDLRSRTIPNGLTAALALGGAAVALLSGWPAMLWTCLAATGVFAGGALLFAIGVMGGGDVKLAAALALWLPAGSVPAFLILTALAGGLVGLLMMLGRTGAALASGQALRPALASGLAAPAPYGVAIAAGGIVQFALGG